MSMRARGLLAVGIALCCVPAAGAMTVSSVSPLQNGLGVPVGASISITFDQPLDPVSADSSVVIVRGNMSGLHPGLISVLGNTLVFDPLEDFAVGDLALVVVTRGLKSLGGDSLIHGFSTYFTIEAIGGTGELEVGAIYPSEEIPYYIYGGDLDKDGDMDIATPNEGTPSVSIYLNNGNGVFGTPAEYPTGTKSSSVYGDDFDNDGDQDLAVANKTSNDVSVLLNNGDGTFGAQTIYDAGSGTQQIYGGDFENDGDIDLATSQTGSNNLAFYFNDGTGHFDSMVTFSYIGADPNGIFGGDFNNDGYFDIAVANFSFATLTVVLGQGDGTFAVGTTTAIGSSTMMYGGDFDGDTDLDIIATRNQTGEVIFAFNNGSGGFDSTIVMAVGLWPLAAWCGDLDGDDDIDAMVSNYASGDLSLYMNLGGGVFQSQRTFDVTESGSFVWFHDLDGDGDLDVSAVDEEADLLYIFLNQNVRFSASPRFGVPPLHVAFQSLAPPGATAWVWDFGDGDSSASENPGHDYGPGVYDVGFSVTVPTATLSETKINYVTVHAESLDVADAAALPGASLIWDVGLINHIPLHEIVLPVNIGSVPGVVSLDSISRVGTRLDGFESQLTLFDNRAQGEMVMRYRADIGGGAPPLAPGDGVIARIFLTVQTNAVPGDQVRAGFEPINVYSAAGLTPDIGFPLLLDSALMTVLCSCPCHGDPVCDSVINVLDVVASVDEAFRAASPTQDVTCAHVSRNDVNCDCVVNILDVVGFVNRAFRGDPSPVCDACVASCP